jgi:hypothetical protein
MALLGLLTWLLVDLLAGLLGGNLVFVSCRLSRACT